jgi:hypothetical protein
MNRTRDNTLVVAAALTERPAAVLNELLTYYPEERP